MIPPEKSDIIFLRNRDAAVIPYDKYTIRLVNMEDKPITTKIPTATISQIKDAKFTEFNISDGGGFIQTIMSFANIKSIAYPALTQDICGQMFDCFVDQDVVSASSDLYHSLVFENQYIDDKNYPYGIEVDETTGQNRTESNVFYNTTLYTGSKAVKNVKLTPLTHYLCDGIVRIMFDDNPDPQVLSLEVIGKVGGSAIRSD
ncbi:MAG: hypothetical protein EZS28_006118 [Streblomastix strix]|uniref:Uncharacterized protein n=1 Tax=Streblomastix strix TaxID=222440 RepID=A0A5J4WUV6_9EUKA|nr:MAG: hypothetical protein EZS28_006118 [Streblomastix strix]